MQFSKTSPSISTLALSPSVKIKVQLWPCQKQQHLSVHEKSPSPWECLGLAFFRGWNFGMWGLLHLPLIIRIPIKQPSYWKDFVAQFKNTEPNRLIKTAERCLKEGIRTWLDRVWSWLGSLWFRTFSRWFHHTPWWQEKTLGKIRKKILQWQTWKPEVWPPKVKKKKHKFGGITFVQGGPRDVSQLQLHIFFNTAGLKLWQMIMWGKDWRSW